MMANGNYHGDAVHMAMPSTGLGQCGSILPNSGTTLLYLVYFGDVITITVGCQRMAVRPCSLVQGSFQQAQHYQVKADRLRNSCTEFGSGMPTTPGAGSGTAMVDDTTVRKVTLEIWTHTPAMSRPTMGLSIRSIFRLQLRAREEGVTKPPLGKGYLPDLDNSDGSTTIEVTQPLRG